ncbi:MAG: Maf family nucleotide pyrophosphatase [Crocinitomicaceae bacterium]
MKIILGSKSPRRRELIQSLGLEAEIELRSEEVDEIFPDDLNPHNVAGYLAKLKATPLLPKLKDHELLITSDTVVLRDNEILGKPENREEAISMIASLSGKKHHVITGVHLQTTEKFLTFSNTTEVHFEELTNEEIAFYVDNFKPYDKAGAYGIQEWIGYVGISKIDGCYYNVMGLPLNALYQTMKHEFKAFTSLRSQ